MSQQGSHSCTWLQPAVLKTHDNCANKPFRHYGCLAAVPWSSVPGQHGYKVSVSRGPPSDKPVLLTGALASSVGQMSGQTVAPRTSF